MGGHCSTISRELLRVKDREAAECGWIGCVLCSITALTDMAEEGNGREEIKWFNLGVGFKVLEGERGKIWESAAPIACVAFI